MNNFKLENLLIEPLYIGLYVPPIVWKGDAVGHMGINDTFFWVLEGECFLTVDSQSYIVKPGQLAYLPKGKMRSYTHVSERFSMWEMAFSAKINGEDLMQTLGLTEHNFVVDIQTKEEMSHVLSRKIFMFKNDRLDTYKKNIVDIENAKSYKEDWVLEKILNTVNYANVSWETTTLDSGAQTITFNAMTKRKLKDVVLEFYISTDSEVPMARSITIGNGENAERISIDDFKNMGKEAAVAADIAISCKLLEFASGAI